MAQLSDSRDRPILNTIIGGVIGIVGTLITQWVTTLSGIEPRMVEAEKMLIPKEMSPGLTAMEGIIQSAPDRQWQIIESLSNAIRKHAPAPAKEKLNSSNTKPASDDVKRALKLIKERNIENDTKSSRYRDGAIDLSASNLKGTDLNNAKLSNVNLSISHLYLIDINNANLRNANLKGTYLRGATLNGSDLNGANLTGYAGDKANTFIQTDLVGAKLVHANLKEADLTGVKFFEPKPGNTKLKEAELRKAELSALKNVKQACNWYLATYSERVSKLLKQENESQEVDQRDGCKKFIDKKID